MDLFNALNNFKQTLFSGIVLAVDVKSYTATILFNDGRTQQNVPWISSSVHVNGTGAHCMYKPDDRVIVAEYELGTFVILGTIPVPDNRTSAFKNNRKVLNQGDYYIAVSDQTFILLQTPDFITISGNYACQLKLDGTNNIVYLRSQRYQVQADGGYFYWDSDPDTHNTVANFVFRDKAAKEANLVHIRAGFHKTEDTEASSAQIDKSVFSIIVKTVTQTGDDTYQEEPKFKLIVGADGRILQSANSIKEVYRDFINRYAETTMTDIAKKSIKNTSLEGGIYETASTEIINTAPYINHKD